MNTITAQNIIYKENLTLKAQAVFVYLADRSNKQNICWPGLKRIAADCKISLSTVQRAIRELLKLGLVMKKPNFRENGSQTSNIYIVTENLSEKEHVKNENLRVQRKIEKTIKRHARKEKLAKMFKASMEQQEKEIVASEDNDLNSGGNLKEHKNRSWISVFAKKLSTLKYLKFNFVSRGVVKKNTL